MTVFLAILAASPATAAPYPLPAHFDPAVNMVGEERGGGVYHSVRGSADLAAELAANGTDEDIALAEKILDAVLACQETRPGHAHYGNYLWTRESPAVQDLNAAGFTQRALIPMMLRHGGRLSPRMRERMLKSIRLGCEAIRRLDVAITYTNIASLDCLSSCLGGELLDDPAIAQRGYAKLERLAELTAENGNVYEFNSPGYVRVTVGALKIIGDLVEDDATRVRARSMAARLALSVALHIQQPSGRLAGPHSRAYFPAVVCEDPPEAEFLHEWLADGTAPAWIAHALTARPVQMQLVETAHADWRIGMTTHQSARFALGTATREISSQTDVFIAHAHLPEADRPAVVYTRYLIDDTWFGDPVRPADRTGSTRMFEEGKALTVQCGPRAIVLYAPRILEHPASLAPASKFRCRSAKLALICTQREFVDEVWAGDRKVEHFPATVEPGEVVALAAGDMLLAVRPLTITDLGCDAPIRLAVVEDDLVLEMYNYLGPEKVFWDRDHKSRFFQGEPQCGFYSEVARRGDYASLEAFVQAVASGTLTDDAQPPVTSYLDDKRRTWTVEYAREAKSLGLEIDLISWELLRRWTQDGELSWPMLECPVARQNAEGTVTVGGAVLTCGEHPAWLFGNPEAKVWAAGYYGPPAPLTLTVPGGSVSVKAMGTGTVVWQNGAVSIEAIGTAGMPRVQGGVLAGSSS